MKFMSKCNNYYKTEIIYIFKQYRVFSDNPLTLHDLGILLLNSKRFKFHNFFYSYYLISVLFAYKHFLSNF